MKRRHLLTLAAVAAAASAAGGRLAWAQQRAAGAPGLRLLVPFAAGGATDITARALAAPLAAHLGRAVTVENRAGAGGAACMAEVAAAAPDGATLGMATLSTHGVNPAVYRNLPYDAINGFTPVTEVVKAPGVLVVHAELPARDFAQFVQHVKARPGQLAYASPGNGTIGHMWGELPGTCSRSRRGRVGAQSG